MDLVIAKNAVPKIEGDLVKSVETIRAVDKILKLNHQGNPVTSLGLTVKTGLEHVLFYSHVSNLSKLASNIKKNVPKTVPQSVHSPYNFENPNLAEISSDEGKAMIKEVIDFTAEIEGKVVVAHPNQVCNNQYELKNYPHEEKFLQLITNAKELTEYARIKGILFTVKNMPFPSTNQDLTDLNFNLGYITQQDGQKLGEEGLYLTEDNCHRAISSETINEVITRKHKKFEEITKELGIQGLPEEKYVSQPPLKDIVRQLKKSIVHLHCNDGKLIDTRRKNWKGPKNVKVFDEAMIIGVGTLCDYSDFFPVIEHHAKEEDLERMFIVLEVYETFSPNKNNPYDTPLNYSVDAIKLYHTLVSEF